MIADFLPLFLQINPGVTIILTQGDSRETMERLKQEEVELAIIGSRYPEEDFDYTPLTPDKIVLAVNSRHHWNGRDSVTPEISSKMVTLLPTPDEEPTGPCVLRSQRQALQWSN